MTTDHAETLAPDAWKPSTDPRNEEYQLEPSAPALEALTDWTDGRPVLDQGNDGACVGYAIATAAGTEDQAERLYSIAKTLDRYPGEAYSGTSVLAGAKAAKALGIISEYRWAGDVEAILAALETGPVVLGLYWTPGMARPQRDPESGEYVMRVDAPKHRSFGHAAVAVGYDPFYGVRIQSSWGTAWADGGRAWLGLRDLETLMYRTGEACVVVPE